jgi:TATA-binding protein-associated factor
MQNPLAVMTLVVERLVPLLSAPDSITKRQGAVECIALILEKMQINIVPYILFLVIPLMGKSN